ncbi:MAG: transcriptional regulator [Candidatus Marinimicrobia bacterium]|nr:transcriptional regulator [Candidatus Neomarinimicrobiota bacterium]
MNTNIAEISKVWSKISDVVSLPHTEKQYNEAVSFLDQLIDIVGENEAHPLASLMETVGTLIEQYENDHYPKPEGDPIGVLKQLMADHSLVQSDLKDIGSQGVVSEILSGKRTLNTRQIRNLCRRFKVNPGVFMPHT